MMSNIPHFIINNKYQKNNELYEHLLSDSILKKICNQITGIEKYTVDFVNKINIGRMAILRHESAIYYISFSENEVKSRNSSFQSFPSALLSFLEDDSNNKKLYYFVLPTESNINTDYFVFMYRLIKTTGASFIDLENNIEEPVKKFSSYLDIVLSKNYLRRKNKSNNSTYITKSEDGDIQVYGKLYGANKYETVLICIALYQITSININIFELEEGSLKKLPKRARDYLLSLDRITITNRTIDADRQDFDLYKNLRSARYIYNLLERFSIKKCFLCDCDIPEIIQGAHIVPVADIKNDKTLTDEDKFEKAIDGNNGMWLCQNHHRLFDTHIIRIYENRKVMYNSSIRESQLHFLKEITTINELSDEVSNPVFINYIKERNSGVKPIDYKPL